MPSVCFFLRTTCFITDVGLCYLYLYFCVRHLLKTAIIWCEFATAAVTRGTNVCSEYNRSGWYSWMLWGTDEGRPSASVLAREIFSARGEQASTWRWH